MEVLAKHHKIIDNNRDIIDIGHSKLQTKVQQYAQSEFTNAVSAQNDVNVYANNDYSLFNCFYNYIDETQTLNIVCLINVENSLELNNKGVYQCDQWVFEKIKLNRNLHS